MARADRGARPGPAPRGRAVRRRGPSRGLSGVPRRGRGPGAGGRPADARRSRAAGARARAAAATSASESPAGSRRSAAPSAAGGRACGLGSGPPRRAAAAAAAVVVILLGLVPEHAPSRDRRLPLASARRLGRGHPDAPSMGKRRQRPGARLSTRDAVPGVAAPRRTARECRRARSATSTTGESDEAGLSSAVTPRRGHRDRPAGRLQDLRGAVAVPLGGRGRLVDADNHGSTRTPDETEPLGDRQARMAVRSDSKERSVDDQERQPSAAAGATLAVRRWRQSAPGDAGHERGATSSSAEHEHRDRSAEAPAAAAPRPSTSARPTTSSTPSDPTVKAGKVTINVSNDGQADPQHRGRGPERRSRSWSPTGAGESGTLTVDLSKPGKYEFYCPVDNHKRWAWRARSRSSRPSRPPGKGHSAAWRRPPAFPGNAICAKRPLVERLSADDTRILRLESDAIAGHTLKLAIVEPAPDGKPLTVERVRDRVEARLGRPATRPPAPGADAVAARRARPGSTTRQFDIRNHVRPAPGAGERPRPADAAGRGGDGRAPRSRATALVRRRRRPALRRPHRARDPHPPLPRGRRHLPADALPAALGRRGRRRARLASSAWHPEPAPGRARLLASGAGSRLRGVGRRAGRRRPRGGLAAPLAPEPAASWPLCPRPCGASSGRWAPTRRSIAASAATARSPSPPASWTT